MEENKITGKNRPNRFPELRELKEGECIMYDLESGAPYITTIEHRDHMQKMWTELSKISTAGEKVGCIYMFGTGGSGESPSLLNEIYFNPESYSLKTAYEKMVKENISIHWPAESPKKDDNS